MHEIKFRGEESARFARFAMETLNNNIKNIEIIIEGREPLTSRFVKIKGILKGARLDGYRRHIEVIESGSNMEYWIAGTNATRSIAAQHITFRISDEDFLQLKFICKANRIYIPGLIDSPDYLGEKWFLIDNATKDISEENLFGLLNLLNVDENSEIIREILLDLRSFVDIVAINKRLQQICEEKIIALLPNVIERECRIALVELIGYLGSDNLSNELGKILINKNEDCHVVWAAAIAVGRLSTKSAIGNLIEAYNALVDNGETIVESCDVTDEQWVHAAIMLGLARHASDTNRNILEKYFCKKLDCKNQILRRYACLGLSKFSDFEENTISLLVEILGDTTAPISVQGYIALALTSALDSCDDNHREKIENYLQNYINSDNEVSIEPETLWGLEYLAELASILECHTVAARFHKQLSDLFNDWRRDYYNAIFLYERGDALVVQGLNNEALECFFKAEYEIEKIKLIDEESKTIVAFRKDIIDARQKLQSIIMSWLQNVLMQEIEVLCQRLESEVILVYKRYKDSIDNSIGDKKLSERERKYITGTVRILEIIMLIMKLDIECKNRLPSLDAISSLSDQIYEGIKTVGISVTSSKGLRHLVQTLLKSVEEILDTLRKDVAKESKLRATRALVSEFKGLTSKTTWPMPARACPLGGLGKGHLKIQKGDLHGDGSQDNPLIFSRSSPIVINILVTIIEMAPGGLVHANVECNPGNVGVKKIDVHIVEGSKLITFVLPDVLASQISTKIDFTLRFESREIYQESDVLSIYARKE